MEEEKKGKKRKEGLIKAMLLAEKAGREVSLGKERFA